MNWNKHHSILLLLSAGIIFAAAGFIYKAAERYTKEIHRTNEQELKVNLEAGLGKILIEKGTSNQIVQLDIDAKLSGKLSDYVKYDKRDEVGYLRINTTDILIEERNEKKRKIRLSGLKYNKWKMRFTDAIPISFDIELGMGKGEFDFTGMQVKDLELSTGASSVVLRFDKPNKSKIESINIETGLSKFKGYGLGNANFMHLKFEGGVGSYVLDFSGGLTKEVDVDIKVGLGSITIIIPDNIGAKVYYKKSFIASIDLPGDFDEGEEDNYYSSNYYSSKGKINMQIEAGLGSVKVKR